ncbi:hypothetical protein LX32DRAFT_406863 [Colletotrichum zoysiae]|uniref:Uncharacterized protein n=1 Tax=Colletotrichum zoysiae TaxID=1216348 RepID=A0AAD9M4J3_9PEZI|nr:hypothetical protein LX32DRAFT_406863 [Colletotrichum zoysiae]
MPSPSIVGRFGHLLRWSPMAALGTCTFIHSSFLQQHSTAQHRPPEEAHQVPARPQSAPKSSRVESTQSPLCPPLTDRVRVAWKRIARIALAEVSFLLLLLILASSSFCFDIPSCSC